MFPQSILSGRINIVKIVTLLKAYYIINTVPINMPGTFFTNSVEINAEIYIERLETQAVQGNSEQKHFCGSPIIPDFKIIL